MDAAQKYVMGDKTKPECPLKHIDHKYTVSMVLQFIEILNIYNNEYSYYINKIKHIHFSQGKFSPSMSLVTSDLALGLMTLPVFASRRTKDGIPRIPNFFMVSCCINKNINFR